MVWLRRAREKSYRHAGSYRVPALADQVTPIGDRLFSLWVDLHHVKDTIGLRLVEWRLRWWRLDVNRVAGRCLGAGCRDQGPCSVLRSTKLIALGMKLCFDALRTDLVAARSISNLATVVCGCRRMPVRGTHVCLRAKDDVDTRVAAPTRHSPVESI